MTSLDLTQPGILATSAAATVTLAAPMGRFSLRARGDLGPLNAALGLPLPQTIGEVAKGSDREALCLGPDEWVVLCAPSDKAALQEACAGVYDTLVHSLVDVSERELTLHIEGPAAKTLLTLGLPRDPETIPQGAARRTVFDGATVVLWHDAGGAWRMDVWASFAPHVLHLLVTGVSELAAELA